MNWYKKSNIMGDFEKQMWLKFVKENPQFLSWLPEKYKDDPDFPVSITTQQPPVIKLKKNILQDEQDDICKTNDELFEELMLGISPTIEELMLGDPVKKPLKKLKGDPDPSLEFSADYSYNNLNSAVFDDAIETILHPYTVISKMHKYKNIKPKIYEQKCENTIIPECPHCKAEYTWNEGECPHLVLASSNFEGYSKIRMPVITQVANEIDSIMKNWDQYVYKEKYVIAVAPDVSAMVIDWLEGTKFPLNAVTPIYNMNYLILGNYHSDLGLALLFSKMPNFLTVFTTADNGTSAVDCIALYDSEGNNGNI